ncbi:activator-dependent family glycosyltransferase [Streptomyces spiramenti]|uniref:Activator-dependent family glycosyltransferase n=1 Tax=Streptomyces spiramenti TaxID=2720606 RepID=A0ABX1AG05_9ACTN|nr:activator-dependent family glycosyltransferase [Streptomyces spiramenti]NJP64819.1 activator-dependent family glycosyltransferase [Streptomyces spiramenti]
MRVLFTVFAAKPHLFNQVPLAWALRAAGHEVRVASQPDLAEAITRTGLTAVPVGDALDLAGSFRDPGGGPGGDGRRLTGVTDPDPERLDWNGILGVFTLGCAVEYEHITSRSVVDDLVEFCRDWEPDLVVWDALTFAGAIAARACGAAHARMLFGLDYTSRMLDVYEDRMALLPVEQRDDPVSDWLAGRLARYDVPYDPSLDRELMTGQWTIDPTPEWMQLPLAVDRLGMRHVTYNGPTGVQPWVPEVPDRPRVCFSMGMSGRELLGRDKVSVSGDGRGEDPVGSVLRALAELDIELVATLTADQRAAVGELPDNVRAVDFVPLNDLLPTCAAVVHHGGFGTVGSVLPHAVPSVTVPAPWWDEAALGRHLAERGAGILVEPEEATPEVLRDGVARLLKEPSFATAAREVRAELMRVPPPAGIVEQLVERVGAARRARG